MSKPMRLVLIGAGGLLALSLGHFIFHYVSVVGEIFPFTVCGP